MKRTAQPQGQLARLTTLGGLLGIKTQALLPRLAPVAAACDEHLRVIVPHGFDALAISTRTDRATALAVCGAWLDGIPGDAFTLEIDAATTTAWSDEAALPATAPAAVHAFADDVDAIGFDGTTWTYAIELDNVDVDAAVARLDALAADRGVTTAQRRVVDSLHRSLARQMASRFSLRARDGVLEPTLDPSLVLAWDRVEWAPIQSMLKGFYPAGSGVDKISRLSRSADAEHATVELVLGRVDPPGLRFAFDVV